MGLRDVLARRDEELSARLVARRPALRTVLEQVAAPARAIGLGAVDVLVARGLIDLPDVAAAARSAPWPPIVWGDLAIYGEVGRGAHGTVYACRHRDGAEVALKVLRPGETGLNAERLLREAQVLARLDHPGIVRLFGSGQEEGTPWLLTELLPGASLADLGPQPAGRALALVEQVAQALTFAHAQGVIHRDLKPSNVLLDAAGRPRVVDFGLARDVTAGRALTESGAMLGTLGFAAPEQVGGAARVDARADVWALGALIVALLTGHAPFTPASTLGAWLARARKGFGPLPPRADLPPQVATIVDSIVGHALRVDPAARPDAAQVASALTFACRAAG